MLQQSKVNRLLGKQPMTDSTTYFDWHNYNILFTNCNKKMKNLPFI